MCRAIGSWLSTPSRVGIIGVLAGLTAGAAETGRAQESPRPSYGFRGLEIYKVDPSAGRLTCVDVNGDDLLDIAVVNNKRATIDFFLQKTPAEIASSKVESVEYDNINEIASDARFRKESYVTSKRVYDMVLADLGGSPSPDLAFYGDPKELVIVERVAGGWSETPRRFGITEGRPSTRGLATGDLNGDGRNDLALLGNDKTFVLYQSAEGRLLDPVELPSSESKITAILIADVSGDGRDDLVLLGSGLTDPVRLRVQGEAGLGPEVSIEAAAFRSYLVGDVTGDSQPEFSVVQEMTGRLVVHRLEYGPSTRTGPLGGIRIYPLASAADVGAGRVVFGDVDGDGKIDVLELAPKSAQLRLHRQGAGGQLLPAKPFPTLAGLSSAVLGDIDGDGRNEVVVISGDEKAIGVTRWDGARLPFPKSVPLEGKPRGCGLVALDDSGGSELAVAVENGNKTEVRFFRAGDPLERLEESVAIEGAKDPPERMALFDADQDGADDIFLFFRYEPLRLYVRERAPGESDVRFVDISGSADFGRGLVQGVVTESFNSGDIDGDGKAEFLLTKKNFARAFRVTPDRVLEVVEQLNTPEPDAAVVGVATGDWDGDGKAEACLLEKSNGRLWFLSRNEGGPFEVSRRFEIPKFSYDSLLSRDLDGDGREDLFVGGEDRFGVLYAGGKDYRLVRVAEYETELKDAFLDQIVAGDLNSDGTKEVLVSEITFHLLEVLGFDQDSELERRLRFKTFEESAVSADYDDVRRSRQPREMTIADVTADGKADVVLLIHDRILVYPQE